MRRRECCCTSADWPTSLQVRELLAERGVDVSHRTILLWAQVFGPLLAAEVRRRRRVGRRWFVDEVFLFRKSEKRYLYRAIDEDGVVVDVLLRDHRDTASAEAFFRQAIERAHVIPVEVITDYHQPYVKAVATTCPGAQHVRTGLHQARGEPTKDSIERSHVPTRDRLQNSRGLKRTQTGQRFLEGFEALRHRLRGGRPGAGQLVRGPAPHAGPEGRRCHRRARTPSALALSIRPGLAGRRSRAGRTSPYALQHSTSFRTPCQIAWLREAALSWRTKPS